MKDYLFAIAMVLIVCATVVFVVDIACLAAKEIAWMECKK
jgi:hypothetical protein